MWFSRAAATAAVFLVAGFARAEPLPLRLALPTSADELFAESLAAFERLTSTAPAQFVVEPTTVPGAIGILDALDAGEVDAAILSTDLFPNRVEGFVSGGDVAATRQRQESQLGLSDLGRLENFGLAGLAFWNAPPGQIVASGPIEAVDDLAGLKIVTSSDAQISVLQSLGARAFKMSFAEVNSALVAGAIDAIEVSPTSSSLTQALQQVAETVVENAGSANEFYFVVRKEYWLNLNMRKRATLARAAREAGMISDVVAQSKSATFLSDLKSAGVQVVSLTQDQREQFQAASLKAWTNLPDSPDPALLTLAYSTSFATKPDQKGALRSAAASREVLFMTDRASEDDENFEFRFGTSRVSGSVNLGLATIDFAANRRLGDALDTVSTIGSLTAFTTRDEFAAKLKAAAEGANSPGALVLVHGYNNTFADAVRRAAHFAIETGFDGPVVAFSWPSEGAALLYLHDADRIATTRASFRESMRLITETLGRNRVNLLSHSMGTRVLLDYTDTLRALGESGQRAGKFRSITMAAADTPNEYLATQVEFIRGLSDRVTVYFSENDRALWVSNELHSMKRVGNNKAAELFVSAETKPFGDSGFDFISAREIDDRLLTFSPRHAYLFDKQIGLADAAALLSDIMSAEARSASAPDRIIALTNEGKRFWSLRP